MINSIKTLAYYLSLTGIIFTLTACTVMGPDYEQPSVEWLQEWQPSTYKQKTSRQSDQDDISVWWKIFNDPILNKLINETKKENYTLKIAGLKIFESRALLAIVSTSIYPQLQQLSGSSTYINKQYHGGNKSDLHYTQNQGDFSVGWELDFWGRFQRSIESADAAFFASISNQQDIQVLLSAQVAASYFSYRTTQARIAIAHKNASIQKRSLEITTNLFESGEGSELDLQQAKTQYYGTLSSIPELEIALAQSRNALAVLLGKTPKSLPELENNNTYHWPVVSPKQFHNIPASILTRRPDIRTAAWQAAAQSAQIGVAEAEYYPAISLFGTIGLSGSSLSGTSNTVTMAIGPSFTWNILDYDRIENNIRIQDARLQQLLEQYQNLVLQAAKEVDDAAYSIVKRHEKALLIVQGVNASQRALDIANTRFREGYADFQRVLDAQRAMFAQTDGQLINQGSYVSAIISLYKSIGGGWTDMPVTQLITPKIKETMQQRTDWGDLLTAPLLSEAQNSAPEKETAQK